MLSLGFAIRAAAAPLNRIVARGLQSTGVLHGTNVALVLSGCGVYDGTEIHEASACLVHLSRGGATVSMFAPNTDQMHVIDHTKGAPSEGEKRNVLVESARIARGNITQLNDLKTTDFDAIIFPGGFGAAKNLCTFAVDGKDCTVNPDVSRVLKEFHSAKKPIGRTERHGYRVNSLPEKPKKMLRRLCCIAPVLAAKVLPGCSLTVGSDQEEDGKWPHAGTAGAINEMGSKHVKTNVTSAHIDESNKIVTTAAFMCNTGVHEIFDGIGSMITNVLKLAGK